MLDPLYRAVAWIVVNIHAGLAPVFGAASGASWALSIVLLTVAMRLVLFPLFVKQIKTQRAMQVLAPKVKELQGKYRHDRERLNTELMALYREQGANPLTGCLPLLLQIPVFIALFGVLNKIKPTVGAGGVAVYPTDVPGFPEQLIESAAKAKIFGVPIAAAFNSGSDVLNALNANATSVKVLTTTLIVLMGVTTFFTQRQLMARTGAVEGAQATQQKIMLYVLPFTFGIFGFRFPLGVLLYWLTTNVWSMGQQFFVIRRMGPGPAAGGSPPTKPSAGQRPPPPPPAGEPPPRGAGRRTPAPLATSASARRPANRPGKRSRSQRRGRRR